MFRVHAGVVDYAILAVYFVVVLGIGLAVRRQVHTGLDYGVVLTVMGLFASDAARAKAAGININLWAGLVILAGGACFLAWSALRPLRAGDVEAADQDRSEAR